MKDLFRVILVLVGACTGLFAIAAVGYGIFGIFVAVFFTGPGFVGEGHFYASALLLISLAMLTAGAAAGIVSYICWTRWHRQRA